MAIPMAMGNELHRSRGPVAARTDKGLDALVARRSRAAMERARETKMVSP